MRRRLRMAYFSPLPPARTGIADYSRELLPYLTATADVALFVEDGIEVDPAVLDAYPHYFMSQYPLRRWDYDVALFQMGNSSYHTALYKVFRMYPGVIVLHDYYVHHFYCSQTVDRGDYAAYGRELGYELGAAGLRLADEVRTGQRPPPYFGVPLNRRLADLALGTIVHSQGVRELLWQDSAHRLVAVAPAPIQPYAVTERRTVVGWPDDALVFGSFGMVSLEKHLDHILRVFARLCAERSDVRYLVVGDWGAGGVDLPGIIAELGLQDRVYCTGFAPDLQSFTDWLAAVDVIVNLRFPTVGETSATALRGLAAGRPLIVNGHGWYAELPDTVSLKVPPGDDDALLQAMRALSSDGLLRSRMSEAAQIYATSVHAPSCTATAYLTFIEALLTQHTKAYSPP